MTASSSVTTDHHPGGQIIITLDCTNNGVKNASLNSKRPLQISRLFHGQPIELALRLLPRLFSICGNAHGQAAVTAVENALGIIPGTAISKARDILVAMETIREHLWRIILTWPGYVNHPVSTDVISAIIARQNQLKAALFGQSNPYQPARVPPEWPFDINQAESIIIDLKTDLENRLFNGSIPHWLKQYSPESTFDPINSDSTTAQLMALLIEKDWARLGGEQFNPLPENELADYCRNLNETDWQTFIYFPQWKNQPCETTALSRQYKSLWLHPFAEKYGYGLLTRLYARLYEVSQLPDRMLASLGQMLDASRTGLYPEINTFAGEGYCQVEAARGRLIHHVKMNHDRILNYHIVAPTEWNFHPQGNLAESLKMLRGSPQEIEQQARLLIEAIDPCVHYQIELICHA